MDSLLMNLPGFEPEAALKMLNNNTKLYTSVLKRFYTQYSSSFEQFSDTIKNSGDWEVIQREAHTIKGLAGTIGAPALHDRALALETAIKDAPDAGNIDQAQVAAKAASFIDEFSRVLDVLKNALPE